VTLHLMMLMDLLEHDWVVIFAALVLESVEEEEEEK
jgi:hypothetical protein